eukprot:COSAG04_NODE_2898_length_3405_cov_2.819419_2_plen_170_part_00
MFALRALAVCALAAVSSALALPGDGRWKALELPIASPEPAVWRVDATKPPLITIAGADGNSVTAGDGAVLTPGDDTTYAVLTTNATRSFSFLLIEEAGWDKKAPAKSDSTPFPSPAKNSTVGAEAGGCCSCGGGSMAGCATAIGSCVGACVGSGGWACMSCLGMYAGCW